MSLDVLNFRILRKIFVFQKSEKSYKPATTLDVTHYINILLLLAHELTRDIFLAHYATA